MTTPDVSGAGHTVTIASTSFSTAIRSHIRKEPERKESINHEKFHKEGIRFQRRFKLSAIVGDALTNREFDIIKSLINLSRYLIERDFPGMLIGPEPTTDRFHVISYGKEEGKVGHIYICVLLNERPDRRTSRVMNNWVGSVECKEHSLL